MCEDFEDKLFNMIRTNESKNDSGIQEKLTIDECLQKAGGFGRLRWAMLVYAILAKQGTSYFIFALAFLELMPAFECRNSINDPFVPCGDLSSLRSSSKICKDHSLIDRDLWRIDYTDSKSFHNWMTELELFCYSDFMIGLLGSVVFVGFALSGILLKQADNFGRKWTALSGILASCAIAFVLFFARNLYVIYVFLFLAGLFIYRNVAVYILVLEMVPEKYRIYASSCILSAEAMLTVPPITIFFLSGGKNMYHILAVGVGLSVISSISAFFVPESPKFLYGKKRFSALRSNLAYIARFNGTSMENYIIEGEVDFESSDLSLEKPVFQKSSSVEYNQDILDEQSLDKVKKSEEVQFFNIGQQKEFSVMEELKNRRTLINLICVIAIFCSVTFNYYLIGFFLKYVGGNIFVNGLATAVSDICGNYAGAFVQKLIGSKKTILLCLIIGLIAAIPLLFTTNPILIAVCVFGGRFSIQGGITIAYFLNPETFPPLFVPFSFSVTNLICRVINIFAPQIAEIKPRQTPIIILMCMTGLAVIFALILKPGIKR
ncbi:unnamed protein product [Moneuplotes crassus]|uniref:Uncharacterized protein n=1 Tax=Euplotes crassus TaxID=5936 RepID=A0AAD1U8D6_EUPCR|nr:unnamed protein product [Moneuplotes crassus]